MKVEPECASCLLYRGYLEIRESTTDPNVQFEAMSALNRLLARGFRPTAVAAHLGTERDKTIKKITENPDPYLKAKQLSNQNALKLLPHVDRIVSEEPSSYPRWRKACLCSIVGNVMEFDIPGHTFNFEDIEGMIRRAEEDLAVDEISKIYDVAKKAKSILYLTDNAGEIAFDTLLIREFKNLGSWVAVAVKEKPVLNDATTEDAKCVGMFNVADKVISTGSDSVGLIPNECSSDFLELYQSVDLVVAKGMGYAETLTETDLKSPHALLLRTKCRPVANFFGVNRGKNVAKLMC